MNLFALCVIMSCFASNIKLRASVRFMSQCYNVCCCFRGDRIACMVQSLLVYNIDASLFFITALTDLFFVVTSG